MKNLLITGGSSGIGKATAELFAERGWRVYELSRHGVSATGITHIDCDVTSDESVRAAVAEVLREVEHLDVVIANAGFGISGAIEFTDMADAKRQFDVNLFGALRLTQAVLPQLRQQRNGRIIFTTSVAAAIAIPYQAFYSASKSALNTLALALQNEVREFGIRVSVLMPGDVATGFTAARDKSIAGADVYTHIEHAVAAMEKDEQNGLAPRQMAKQFYHIATCRSPRPQYIGGFLYVLICLLDRILPKRLVNWIVGKLYA